MAGFTVIGGGGFIGSRLVLHLQAEGNSCRAPARGEALGRRSLGHVVYCAGLTGDWQGQPYEAVDAHVCTLTEVARTCGFDSLLYLSSTRVYDRHPGPLAHEDDTVLTKPQNAGDIYALSKALGEAVTLAAGGRVARLSNVYGPQLEGHAFLSVVLREAVDRGRVTLESSLESARDYVSVDDAVALLARIAVDGQERVYNVASGTSVTNLELTEALADLTDCKVVVRPGAPRVVRPAIDISRATEEFGYAPARLLDDLPWLLGAVRS
jgi:nucleoside-diphosphate-sugar epimerase